MRERRDETRKRRNEGVRIQRKLDMMTTNFRQPELRKTTATGNEMKP